MSPRQQKVHVVSVRFTEEEYRALTHACEAEKSRSLSEFTRAAMKERLALAAVRGRPLLQQDPGLLARRLELLHRELRSATEHVADMLGHGREEFSATQTEVSTPAHALFE